MARPSKYNQEFRERAVRLVPERGEEYPSVFEAIRSIAAKEADVGDRVRESAATIYQALIVAELTSVIGSEPHERIDARTVQRNGHRPRTVSTTAGDLCLRIPKLRTGSFFPSLLERRRRVDRALDAVVTEAFLHGMPIRKVDDLVKALAWTPGIARSEVSRISAQTWRSPRSAAAP